MRQTSIPFQDTGYFSNLICDYLNQKETLKPFYNRFPSIENFRAQILEKQASATFSESQRTVLVDALKEQYQSVEASEATLNNIHALHEPTTFTITTGHQLNLFTGPLYFLYKIISTINLCKILKEVYPDYDFVPIYWMATEDHDFEEINYFNFKGKKIKWNQETGGAVGDLSTEGLEKVADLLSAELGASINAKYLIDLFKNAYLKHEKLSAATRFLANELFKDYGLVVLDAHDASLKRLLVPFMKRELLDQVSSCAVSKTNEALAAISDNYTIQVNPRDINLFYLAENLRERIVFENDSYKVLNTDIIWSKDEILNEVETSPETFSPNVIMRPLYQEVILPNLCYIGGGGELAYWLQLKAYFDEVNVVFPVLLLRNSVLVQSESQSNKLEKLAISNSDLFLDADSLTTKKVKQISNIDIDFSDQKDFLKDQFKDLYELAELTDKSFLGAVKAQEVKQLKGLEHLEKRLLKAQKRKLSDHVDRLAKLHQELFPNSSLQERQKNFSEFYLEYGDSLIAELIADLDPLKMEFLIKTLA